MPSVDTILRESIAPFIPEYAVRLPQIELATRMEQAILQKRHLVAEASTGLGKSASYIASIISARKTVGGTAIVSTAGLTLQGQLLNKDLPAFQQAFPDLEFAVLKGRTNFPCLLKISEQTPAWYEDWIQEFPDADLGHAPWVTLEEKFAITASSDECLGKECRFYDDCFVYKMKRRAESADIIVSNHHLTILDGMMGSGKLLPEGRMVTVMDESHSLVDVATALNSEKATAFGIIQLAGSFPEIRSDLPATTKRAFSFLESQVGKATKALYQPLEKLESELRLFRGQASNLASSAMTDLAGLKYRAAASRASKYLNTIRTVRNLPDEPDGIARFVSQNHRGHVSAEYAPTDVRELLSRAVFSFPPVILTSATLRTGGTFRFFVSNWGVREIEEHVAPPTFDYSHQAMLIIPELPGPDSPDYYPSVAETYLKFILAAKGGVLALFASYKALNEVYDRASPHLNGLNVLKQGDRGRDELLSSLREDGNGVLFATRSFWEGVDIAGDALRGVIIDRMPFPVPDDPLYSARAELIDAHAEGWSDGSFMTLGLPMATLAFLQGFGRLIRRTTDRGVAVLCDSRVWHKAWGKKLLKSLPKGLTITKDISQAEEFFSWKGEEW